MITVRCPKCGRQIKLANAPAGKAITCPGCGRLIPAPPASPKAQSGPSFLESLGTIEGQQGMDGVAPLATPSQKRAQAQSWAQLRLGLLAVAGLVVLLVVVYLGYTFIKNAARNHAIGSCRATADQAIRAAEAELPQFLYDAADAHLRSALEHVKDAGIADARIDAVADQLSAEQQKVAAQRKNHEDLLAQGYEMFEGRFLSKEQRLAILAERAAKDRPVAETQAATAPLVSKAATEKMFETVRSGTGGDNGGLDRTRLGIGHSGPIRYAFLIDDSGALLEGMPYVIDQLKMFVRELTPDDEFAIFFFQGSRVKQVVDNEIRDVTEHQGFTAGIALQKARTLEALDKVHPEGISNPTKAIQVLFADAHPPDVVYILSQNITGTGRYELRREVLLQAVEKYNPAAGKAAVGPKGEALQLPPAVIHTIQYLYPDPLVQQGFAKATLEELVDQNNIRIAAYWKKRGGLKGNPPPRGKFKYMDATELLGVD